MSTASVSACQLKLGGESWHVGAARAEKSSLSPTSDNRFPRAYRLSDERLIKRIARFGRRHDSDCFLYFQLAVPGEQTCFCLSVPRRVGSAPARNRIKRLVREFLRAHKELWPENAAIVIKAKPSAANIDPVGVAAALTSYLKNE